MSEQLSDRAGLPDLIDRLKQLIPASFRRDAASFRWCGCPASIGAVTPLRPGLSLAGIARVLERAFGIKHAKAVALVINSPGGSPVQSHLIYKRIRAARRGEENSGPRLRRGCRGLRRLHDRLRRRRDHLRSVVDRRLDRRGRRLVRLRRAIEKIGVERRIYTAGEHKVMLDPFLPEKPDDVARLKAIQHEIHDMFIELVKESRGARLKGDEDACSPASTGPAALEIDSAWPTASAISAQRCAQRYGEKVLTPVIAQPTGLLSGLLGRKSPGAGQLSAMESMAGLPAGRQLISAVETRGRFGRSNSGSRNQQVFNGRAI